MNILLINGSPHKDGATKRALSEISNELTRLGAKAYFFEIGSEARHSCIGCGGCGGGSGCVFRDIDELCEIAKSADGIIIGTPTHYKGAYCALTSVLSRLLFSAKNAVLHKPIAAVGVGRRGTVSSAIDEVKKFFEFSSSPIISGCYPPILYASDKESVQKDKEGIQNMRSIARNMYWIAKCIECGAAMQILPPEEEERIKTDIPSL